MHVLYVDENSTVGEIVPVNLGVRRRLSAGDWRETDTGDNRNQTLLLIPGNNMYKLEAGLGLSRSRQLH